MSRWPMVPLGEVLTPVRRPESVQPNRVYRILGAHWYARGLYVKQELSGAEIRAAKVYRVEEGDFIYNRLFAWKGSFAISTKDNHGCHVSNEFPCFRVSADRLDPHYLHYFFSRHGAWSDALALSTGGTPTSRNRLKEDAFLGMPVPLPPLSQQRRVVALINNISLKLEDARQLRLWADQEIEALMSSHLNGVYETSRARCGTVPLADASASITDGAHLTPKFQDEGVKFIFVGNVSSGYLHFSGCKYVSRDYFETIAPTRRPKRGDVLYSAVGATLGVPAIVDCDEDFCFQRHVAIIKPDRDKLNPRYLWHMLRSTALVDTAWSSITGTAQPTVPLRAIKSFEIPLPSLSQQAELVGRLDAIQGQLDRARTQQRAARAIIDTMLPAILHRLLRNDG